METQYVGNTQVNHLNNFTRASIGDKIMLKIRKNPLMLT